MATDTSERGLERLICTALAGHACDPPKEGKVAEVRPGYGGVGWRGGSPHDYDREFCVDRVQLAAFLGGTQPPAAEALIPDGGGPAARKFLARPALAPQVFRGTSKSPFAGVPACRLCALAGGSNAFAAHRSPLLGHVYAQIVP